VNFKNLPPPPGSKSAPIFSFASIMTSNGIVSSYPSKTLTNYIGGTFTTSSSTRSLPVTNPFDGSTITSVVLSTSNDVDIAVQAAQKAFEQWSKVNVKTRILKLMKLHQLMTDHLEELADMVVKEHGKNIIEAKASITKGMETLEVVTVCGSVN
jgi:malonate-semialdehyde dehydrogenase (acetylating)/methylmalonate-semialdehyde dehydrogenase